MRREVGIPLGGSWNLGQPAVADRAIREERIDFVLFGCPDPQSLLLEDWARWLRRSAPDDPDPGWPTVAQDEAGRPAQADGGQG